jgi:hypothetical protein
MTDMFHYQDVFKTINIPKNERHLLHQSLSLFDSAFGTGKWSPYLSRTVDNHNASQVFWERDETGARFYDRMVLSALDRGVTIAIEHRDFDVPEQSTRKSLLMGSGALVVFESNLRARGLLDNGSSSAEASHAFKEDFYKVAARLALYRGAGIQNPADQNETISAIFANAA